MKIKSNYYGKKDTNEVQSVQEKKNKTVHNRGNFRMELSHNGKIYVFLPGKTTIVPRDMVIPTDLNNLHVEQ